MAVTFHEKAPAFHLKYKKYLKKWVKQSIVWEHYIPGDINFVFETDEEVYRINVKYLNHDWYTDVISFDYNEENVINGDIIISIERVRENSEKLNLNYEDELRRVMIHGVLHLCGYDDKSTMERKNMRKLENKYLKVWEKIRE